MRAGWVAPMTGDALVMGLFVGVGAVHVADREVVDRNLCFGHGYLPLFVLESSFSDDARQVEAAEPSQRRPLGDDGREQDHGGGGDER